MNELKGYFEGKKDAIVPYEAVKAVYPHIGSPTFSVIFGPGESDYIECTNKNQIEYYKEWLALKIDRLYGAMVHERKICAELDGDMA